MRRYWPEWDDPNEGLDGRGKPYGPKKGIEISRRRRRGQSIPKHFRTNMDSFCEQTGKLGCTLTEFYDWLWNRPNNQ